MQAQAQILNLLRELQLEQGVSYLFITHNIGVVEYIANEVMVMRAGVIEERGRIESVLSNPTQAYTAALMAAVPRLGVYGFVGIRRWILTTLWPLYQGFGGVSPSRNP